MKRASRGVAVVAALLLTRAAPAIGQAGSESPHGALATPCAVCHSPEAWKPARIDKTFDHARLGFPLADAHRAVACGSCHRSLEFGRVAKTCAACHQDVHRGEVGVDCAQCHDTRAFADPTAGARAHGLTRFPLEGAHRSVDCRACHGAGEGGRLTFRGAPSECVACHRDDFGRTANPPHQAAAFPTTCGTCHTVARWSGAPFDHQRTQFPLTGAHLAATCRDCHADGAYADKATACVSCHRTDFDGAATPPHQAAGFPTDCASCHSTATWDGATFDHQTSAFPLTGAHQAVTCQQCHGDNVYDGKPAACLACHQTAYDRTANPPHQAAGFPTDCASCHTTATWTGGSFSHQATQFPLTGAHLATPCQQCHGDKVYDGKPTACLACHQPDYNQTSNPPHQSAGFPTDCASCHTTATWTGGSFNHQATQFPLTGAHLATPCQQCHADNVYDGKPTTCVSCHQTDYTQTTSPAHQPAGFSTACATCHTTATWTGGTFDHQATQFPLTGAHVATPCRQCHADNVYDGKPTTCVSCHQTDYTQTTNPSHSAAGFPTDCTACHTTATWSGASFDHDGQYFPIYSGKHAGKWNACSSCHDNPASFAVFTCLSCHEHNKTKMDDTHKSQAGYQYQSQACLSCHPRGTKP